VHLGALAFIAIDTVIANFYVDYYKSYPKSPAIEADTKARADWGIAKCIVGIFPCLLQLYYSIGLLVMRKTLPKRVCPLNSKDFTPGPIQSHSSTRSMMMMVKALIQAHAAVGVSRAASAASAAYLQVVEV
jgi:hypothetical protein